VRGWRKEGEMTQTLYAHMNKKKSSSIPHLSSMLLEPQGSCPQSFRQEFEEEGESALTYLHCNPTDTKTFTLKSYYLSLLNKVSGKKELSNLQKSAKT
jgi:hypothetical protein